MKKFYTKRRQAGFTLVELMIVVVLLGIIAAIVISNMVGNTDSARAQLLKRVSKSSVESIAQIARTCGTSSAVSGSVLPASGRTMLDIVFLGEPAVSATYKTCYADSSVRALRDSVTKSGSTWQVGAFPMNVTGGGLAKFNVEFQRVPEATVLALAQAYTENLTTLAASDTTSDVIRYGAASGGTRTVTVVLD